MQALNQFFIYLFWHLRHQEISQKIYKFSFTKRIHIVDSRLYNFHKKVT